MTIWKSVIIDPDQSTHTVGAAVSLPKGAQVVHVGMQGTKICIWSLVNPGKSTVLRQFIVAGTGHVVRSDAVYVGTTMDPPYVWHVFEVI